MTDRKMYRLMHDTARAMAVAHVQAAPHGYIVEIKPPSRSLEQNARLWAMLTEVSEQVDWYGSKLTPTEWKHVFTASLKKQKVIPGLDGEFVVLPSGTSTMTIPEMSDMIELIYAFAVPRGVVFTDPRGVAA